MGKNWMLIVFLLSIATCALNNGSSPPGATTSEVENPGQHQDIAPVLQTAVDTARDGDTLLLPAGEFVLDQRVVIRKFISIKGKGRGVGGTKLYRRENVADSVLSGSAWRQMFYFNSQSDASSNIVVSDIYFKGKHPSISSGDGGSIAQDNAIRIDNFKDFVITNCRFEHFGASAIRVRHQDHLTGGLIFNNEFIHNYKKGVDLGYGVSVYGHNDQWTDDPQFGSGNFIFIEDNYFVGHRHAVAGGGAARYVFRRNVVADNLHSHAVDAHEARGGTISQSPGYFSTRAYEIYDNSIYNTKFKDGTPFIDGSAKEPYNRLVRTAIGLRGGEGLVYNNKIEGFRFGIELFVIPHFPGDDSYPVSYQIGYQSGKQLGSRHWGAQLPEGAGDLFIWGNTFISFKADDPGFAPFYTAYERLDRLKKDRDYHRGAPKPGYSPYTYPHPLRSLYQ